MSCRDTAILAREGAAAGKISFFALRGKNLKQVLSHNSCNSVHERANKLLREFSFFE